MLFNSHIFIFTFLPIALAGWFLLNRIRLYKIAGFFLIGMSLWFYGYFNPAYLILIIASLSLNYIVSFLMDKVQKARKAVFILGLCLNIGILGYFKYYDFFVENINALFKTGFALKHILLPLGISFFTLQQISYLADRYKNTAPHYGILEYAGYVTFFPQLIAGPIVLHNELVPQFQDKEKRKFDPLNFRDGVVLFILGLAKKVLIADFFAKTVNFGFEKFVSLDTISAWLVAISYSFEIYFDFSGYSDMAVGLAKMFNFDIPGNFDSPYKALSVSGFWKRWHMTLTRFLTAYIYIPLGGNRKGKLRTCINIMLVFLISGFWHGASWTFIIWGLVHGLGVLVSRRNFLKIKKKIPARFFTFLFVTAAWVIFRSEDLYTLGFFLKAMFVPSYNGFIIDIGSTLTLTPAFYVLIERILHVNISILYPVYTLCLLICFILTGLILRGKNSVELLESRRDQGFTFAFTLGLGILFAWCLVSMTGVSTFLYFNF